MRDKDKAHGDIPGGLEAAYSKGKDTKHTRKGGRMAKRVGRKHGGRKRGRKHGKK